MIEESELPVRSRAVPQIKRARRVSSRATFAAFTLLLLVIGILRNYAVESTLAHRVLNMRRDYSWSAQYTKYIQERMGNHSIPAPLEKLNLPWSPFRFLQSPSNSNVEDDEEADEKLLKELTDLSGSPGDTALPDPNSTSVSISDMLEPMNVRRPGRTELSSTGNTTNHIEKPNDNNSFSFTNRLSTEKENLTENSGKASNGIKNDAAKTELPSEEVEESNGFSGATMFDKTDALSHQGERGGNSLKGSQNHRSGVLLDDESDGEKSEEELNERKVRDLIPAGSKANVIPPIPPVVPAFTSMERNSNVEESSSKVIPPIPTVIPAFAMALNQPKFKFETATPESLSQWQDKPRLRADTVHSLRRLHRVYIAEYEIWHSSVLEKVKSGYLNSTNVRVLLYEGGKAGVGDGLRGVIHAYLCAVLSKRLLLLDCKFPFPLSTVLYLGSSSNYTFDADYFGDSESDYKEANFRKFAHHHDMKIALDDENWITMKKETRPSMNFLLRDVPDRWPEIEPIENLGTLERNPWAAEFFPLIYKSLFRASSELRACVEGFMRDGNTFDTKPFVGIHVRFGEDTNESKSKRFRSELPLLETAQCMAQNAIEMAKMRGIDPPRFFLAGDSSEFRETLRTALVDLDKRSELMFGDWRIKHSNHMRSSSSIDLDAFLGTFSDLLILTHSDSLLHTNSAFADLARWMGGIEAHFEFTRTSCSVEQPKDN